MSEEFAVSRRYLQIARVDSKGKILDFTDPNRTPLVYDPKEPDAYAPKIEVNYTRYNVETAQAEVTHKHYVDVDVMRLLCWDLVNYREGTPLDEYKGGMMDKLGLMKFDAPKLISRRLTINHNATLRIGPAYEFQFVAADGEKGQKGQVQPLRGGQEYLKEFIYVPVEVVRKAALRVFHYLLAKEAAALVPPSDRGPRLDAAVASSWGVPPAA